MIKKKDIVLFVIGVVLMLAVIAAIFIPHIPFKRTRELDIKITGIKFNKYNPDDWEEWTLVLPGTYTDYVFEYRYTDFYSGYFILSPTPEVPDYTYLKDRIAYAWDKDIGASGFTLMHNGVEYEDVDDFKIICDDNFTSFLFVKWYFGGNGNYKVSDGDVFVFPATNIDEALSLANELTDNKYQFGE